MDFRGRHRRPRTACGWWALAARMLALVLALAVMAPLAGMAEDAAFHGGSHHGGTEAMAVGAASDADAADPGLACHLHCGCHQAAPAVTGAPSIPCREAAPPVYARRSETASSIDPDRLPRPPRA